MSRTSQNVVGESCSGPECTLALLGLLAQTPRTTTLLFCSPRFARRWLLFLLCYLLHGRSYMYNIVDAARIIPCSTLVK
jgi:hypothetical protein